MWIVEFFYTGFQSIFANDSVWFGTSFDELWLTKKQFSIFLNTCKILALMCLRQEEGVQTVYCSNIYIDSLDAFDFLSYFNIYSYEAVLN